MLKKLKGWVIILAIFLAGALAGERLQAFTVASDIAYELYQTVRSMI